MSEAFRALARSHQAFYEVAPYYVVLGQKSGATPPTRRVMAGYEVEIFGVRTDDGAPFMPPPRDYALGLAELQKIVTSVSPDVAGSCSLELFPLPGTVVFGPPGHAGRPAAIFRIRILRCGLDRPPDASERRALAEVENQLKALGIARR